MQSIRRSIQVDLLFSLPLPLQRVCTSNRVPTLLIYSLEQLPLDPFFSARSPSLSASPSSRYIYKRVLSVFSSGEEVAAREPRNFIGSSICCDQSISRKRARPSRITPLGNSTWSFFRYFFFPRGKRFIVLYG